MTLLCLMSLGCCLKMFDYAINFFTVNICVDIIVGWMNSSGRLMSPKAAPQHIAPTGCRQPAWRHSVMARGWTSSLLFHSEPWNVFTFRCVFLFFWHSDCCMVLGVVWKKYDYACFFIYIDYYIIVKLYCTCTDGWHFGWYTLTEVFLNWKFIVLRSDRSDIWLTHNHCDLGHAM